ncbi:magnesium and cobalt transporter [Paucidesulfovibrio gracilis DSM 16080]|uniref:Magnesium and cobalt transporter n=1 Tax=Paucidesulfovibrio gracilis DSM 16080 TaxID=1121449 RepID=A0A1T4WMK3_9BACT|nr:hemolysin family protein [Paucidesulfovibrio gracilis]SKA78449.1 magnesium and cobalt transporter [Paucidesulfovibrio gracilis DSM 16080]
MDEGSDSRFWSKMRSLFRSNGHDLEEQILDAQDGGSLKREDASMLLNVLDLNDTTASDIMVPRTDIICADADCSLRHIAKSIVDSGHSRIPIYEETRDRMLGVIHAKDLLSSLLQHDKEDTPVRNLLRDLLFVPEMTNVKYLLATMRSRRTHMAIVVDEYGGTAGLVTLEDVLEEIVGDIEDEYDVLRPDDIQVMENDILLVSGRSTLEELNERFQLDVTSEQVDTLGGYLSEIAGRIPTPGDFFTLGERRYTVKDADAKQIKTILVEPLAPQEEEQQG